MSDFFAQLGSNIRFPDANINGGGPLPTSLSGPAGINGDPDGKINFNNDLLSGIAPYAYGQGRMGSDRNYQQIPHRIQKIIPKLFLPYADVENSQSCVALSHSVDQGDIAFILQSTRVQGQLFDNHALRDASIANLQIPSHTAFINISTVNYLLAGLQRLTKSTPQSSTWAMLARDLGYRYKRGHQRADMLQLISTRMVPFGICAGSEHQGGKHETGLAPVQAAANHVTTLTVDGQNRDLVNLWRNVDISAGDQLIFKLAWMPTHSYTLNHYYKGVVRQTFVCPMNCWQLIPDTFKMMSPEAPLGNAPWAYDYRINGYWRIGQCFQHRASFEADPSNIFHDTSFLRGQLLQVTFAPVWTQCQPLNTEDPAQSSLLDASRRKSNPHSQAAPEPAVSGVKRSWADTFRAPGPSIEPSHLPQFAPNTGPFKLGVRWSLANQQHPSRLGGLLAAPVRPQVINVPVPLHTGASLGLATTASKLSALTSIPTVPAIPSASIAAASIPTARKAQPTSRAALREPVDLVASQPLPAIDMPLVVASKTKDPLVTTTATIAVAAPNARTDATQAVASLRTLNADMTNLDAKTNVSVVKVQRVSTKGKKSSPVYPLTP